MALTNENLVEERVNGIGGVQRVYRVGNYGLSCINSSMAHSFKYAWEIAVVHYMTDDNYTLTYKTPLTSDVVVCMTEAETKEWMAKAFAWFKAHPAKRLSLAVVRRQREAMRAKMSKMAAQ